MFNLLVQTFVVVLVLSGMVFPQGSTGRRIADPNYVVTRTVSEAIISINLKSNELVLKDWEGKHHTVTVNKETKFPTSPQTKKTIALQDLNVGETIRITYRVADATAVDIRPLIFSSKKQ